jgi:mono/diheme cytochrome c family protein
MRPHLVLAGALVLAIASSRWSDAGDHQPARREVDYLRDIQPIFTAHCTSCHGSKEQQSGMRLDDRVNLLLGGDRGEPAIVPGHSDKSFLIGVVAGNNRDLRMPPEGALLTTAQVDLLRAWIDRGATMPVDQQAEHPQHWSLRPLGEVEIPAITDRWITNPIDAFVLARLRERGLEPSPRAEPRIPLWGAVGSALARCDSLG